MGKENGEKCPEIPEDAKSFGWGIRHVQALCMFMCITSLLIVRSSMAVAVLAMTTSHNKSLNKSLNMLLNAPLNTSLNASHNTSLQQNTTGSVNFTNITGIFDPEMTYTTSHYNVEMRNNTINLMQNNSTASSQVNFENSVFIKLETNYTSANNNESFVNGNDFNKNENNVKTNTTDETFWTNDNSSWGNDTVELDYLSTNGNISRNIDVVYDSDTSWTNDSDLLLVNSTKINIKKLVVPINDVVFDEIETYEWDKETQGLILAAFFWGYVTMQVPAGVLARRFGGKPILLFALLSNALLCAALPKLTAWGGWMVVCAIRTVTGLTQACLFPASHTLLGRWLPAGERTALAGLIYGGVNLGIIIGMPLSGVLADTRLGWKLIFYCMAGLMLVAAALWYCLTASSPSQHRWVSEEEREYIERGLNLGNEEKTLRTPWKAILTSRPVYATALAHIGCSVCFVLFFNEMPTYLEKGLKIPLKDSAAFSGIPYLGMWLCATVVGFVCERLYNSGRLTSIQCRRLFNSLATVGVSLGLIVLAYVGPQSRSLAICALVFAVSSSGLFMSGFMLNHLDLSPNFAGLLLSLTNFGANIFSVVLPTFTSWALGNNAENLSGWRVVFLTMAGLVLATNLLYVLLTSSDRQPWDDPAFGDKLLATTEEVVPVMSEKENEANETSS